MMEGEAEGNSHEGLSGEGDVANREDPSSDSSAVRVRAHSLPEGHARTGRQGEGNSLYSSSQDLAFHVMFIEMRMRKYLYRIHLESLCM